MIYRLRYCNKDGVEARVDIQKGSATPVINVEGTERPFVLSYNNDKGDKSGMFLSSSADIEIYETTEFNIDNLKTLNETELSVTHYINNVISWQGFIIPDFFSIEVRSNPVITMTASDRLGTLKNVTLSDLPSMISLRELAILCLSKTGLSLPLRTMADFNNGTGVNDFFNSKILTQRLSDTKGRSISCYDILSSILTASNSFLVQRSGSWHIINKIQHEAGSGKLYTGATSFINWSDVIFNFSDISIGGRRTIIPVASTVGVFHEFGGGRIYPENYDFSLDLTGWTAVNGFVAVIDNRKVDNFVSGTGVISQEWTTDPVFGDATEKKYLVNDNYGINYDFADKPYLRSSNIPVTYPNISQVKVNVEVNATGPYIDSETYRGETNFAVIASDGTSTLHLTGSGTFEPLSGDPFLHKVLFDGDTHLQAVTSSRSVNGVLAVQDGNLSGYNVTIRIYGYTKGVTGGRFLVTTLVNSVAVTITDISDEAKGTLYKTERVDNFTKAHDIDTSLFADYLTTGLNGYFYSFPIDDTSLIYNSANELTSKWTAYNDTEQLPLLQHITRQRSRLFSVAHDLLSAEIEATDFDPLAIFVACGIRHTVVSAQFDFFKSNLSVELEEVAFQNATVRDFIYSYFGDGESGIKSIGGISGGTGGGGSTGGGLTPEQIEILSWWKKDPDNPDTIFTEMNAYSTKELSAYGVGDEGGGGGGSLVTWGATSNGYSHLTVEGVSKTVALQGHTHSWSQVTEKPSTFAPSPHTHSISDVTGLQTSLDNKYNTPSGTASQYIKGDGSLGTFPSIPQGTVTSVGISVPTGLSVSNSPITSSGVIAIGLQTGYSIPTTAKQGQWDAVVTDFGNLEIGGRNLFLDSWGETREDGLVSRYALSSKIENGENFVARIKIKENTSIEWGNPDLYTQVIDGVNNQTRIGYLTEVSKGLWELKGTWDNKTGDTVEEVTFFMRGGSRPDFIVEWAKLEKGNKATDWSPAPEDQVSDWNTTDVNSFSFIKNKPTTLAGYGITDAYTKTEVNSALNLKLDKSVFDDLFEKVEVSTGVFAIKAKYNFYGVGEVSAYGIGSGGGSGGEGIIETVYGYGNLGQTFNNANLTDTFNAYTINQINTRLVAVESGSATTVNTTGTGNAITSISKAGSVITANKDLTFSLAGHTHTISDITNLQTTLNNKLETSIFNTHNTDNIRHITGAERTKWDGVVTDFGNLEIGGRNYALGTSSIFSDISWSSWNGYMYGQAQRIPVTGGEYYTARVFLKTDITNDRNVGIRFFWYDANDVYTASENSSFLPPGAEGYVELTSEAPSTAVSCTVILRTNTSGGVNNSVRFKKLKLEKGTTPTDWTPAPEDQVSDWLTTDINSLSFIKNKPTSLSQFTDNIGVATHIANTSNPHSVTTAQIGAVDLTTNQSIGGKKTFNTGIKVSQTGYEDFIIFERGASLWSFGMPSNNLVISNGDITDQSNRLITIGSNGNIRIGDYTTNPLYKLDVAGTGRFTGNVTAQTFIGALTGNADTTTKLQTARTIWGQSFDGTGDVTGSLSGATTGSFTSNVNIGGSLNITGTSGYSQGIRIKGVGGISSIWFNAIENTGFQSGMFGMTVNASGMRFRYGTGVSPNDLMMILNNGNVGIGISSPQYKLDVSGTSRFTGVLTAAVSVTSPKVIFNAAGWSMEQVGSELQMRHNNVVKMRFTSAGSIVATEEITAFG